MLMIHACLCILFGLFFCLFDNMSWVFQPQGISLSGANALTAERFDKVPSSFQNEQESVLFFLTMLTLQRPGNGQFDPTCDFSKNVFSREREREREREKPCFFVTFNIIISHVQ